MSARHPSDHLSRLQLRRLLQQAAEETNPAELRRLHRELQKPLWHKRKARRKPERR